MRNVFLGLNDPMLSARNPQMAMPSMPDPRQTIRDIGQLRPTTPQQVTQQPGWLSRTFSKDNQPLSNALIQGGLAMMAQNGPGGGSFSQALAHGLGSGLNAYNQTQQAQQAQRQRFGMVGRLMEYVDSLEWATDGQKRALAVIAQTGDANKLMDTVKNLRPEQQEGFTLAPGARRYDAAGNPIADNPVAQNDGPDYDANFKAAMYSLGMDPREVDFVGLPQDVRAEIMRIAQEYRRSGGTNVSVGGPTGKSASELRGEFQGAEIVSQYDNVNSALNAIEQLFVGAGSDPSSIPEGSPLNSPFSAYEMVVTVAKALDPESVVREGEVKAVENMRSIRDIIGGKWRQIVEGKSPLSLAEMNELRDLVKRRRDAFGVRYNDHLNDYIEFARDDGVEPYMVVGRSRMPAQPTQLGNTTVTPYGGGR